VASVCSRHFVVSAQSPRATCCAPRSREGTDLGPHGQEGDGRTEVWVGRRHHDRPSSNERLSHHDGQGSRLTSSTASRAPLFQATSTRMGITAEQPIDLVLDPRCATRNSCSPRLSARRVCRDVPATNYVRQRGFEKSCRGSARCAAAMSCIATNDTPEAIEHPPSICYEEQTSPFDRVLPEPRTDLRSSTESARPRAVFRVAPPPQSMAARLRSRMKAADPTLCRRVGSHARRGKSVVAEMHQKPFALPLAPVSRRCISIASAAMLLGRSRNATVELPRLPRVPGSDLRVGQTTRGRATGIPNEATAAHTATIVSIDCGAIVNGWQWRNAAFTMGGRRDRRRCATLDRRCRPALVAANSAAMQPGGHLGDVGGGGFEVDRQRGRVRAGPARLLRSRDRPGRCTRIPMSRIVAVAGKRPAGSSLASCWAIEPMLIARRCPRRCRDPGRRNWTVVTAGRFSLARSHDGGTPVVITNKRPRESSPRL